MQPSDESPWSAAETVAGFAQAPPNAVLMRFAREQLLHGGRAAIDLGCGAGRNAVPLAQMGWSVLGIDDSQPMLDAASRRAHDLGIDANVRLALAPMDELPAPDGSFDLVVAHGIWNLARSSSEFRRAVREAARVSKPGAGLFVFTFSRNTFEAEVAPVPGETFVFTQFSGRPQCFLTAGQLTAELGEAGFEPDPAVALTEYNRPVSGMVRAGRGPVIWESAFRFSP